MTAIPIGFRVGITLGIVAALGYSVANLALRRVSDTSFISGWDFWVTALKSLPTAVTAWLLVWRRVWICRQPGLPPRRLVPMLAFVALVIQFGGNLGFQVALGHIGLAITVPLAFAGIICVGAVLGRLLLNDPLTVEIIASMIVISAAICLLSYGILTDAESPHLGTADPWEIVTGILLALTSGCSYGTSGVLIRKFVRGTLAVESALIIFSTTGLVLLGVPAILLTGWEQICAGTLSNWPALLTAGIANAVAFFSLSHSLRVINVNRINVINASQNAMCAVGAIVLFGERLSPAAAAGIAMTIVGLLVLARHAK